MLSTIRMDRPAEIRVRSYDNMDETTSGRQRRDGQRDTGLNGFQSSDTLPRGHNGIYEHRYCRLKNLASK